MGVEAPEQSALAPRLDYYFGAGLATGWSFDYTASLNSAENQIGAHDMNGKNRRHNRSKVLTKYLHH
jgi:hypothetical protein